VPKHGRRSQYSIRKTWTALLLNSLFPNSFLQILLSAALSENGVPNKQGERLYKWLLEYIYAGNIKYLYASWLEAKKLGGDNE